MRAGFYHGDRFDLFRNSETVLDESKITVVLDIPDIYIGQVFRYNNIIYVVCIISHAHNFAFLKELTITDGEEKSFEPNIICPYCGTVERDSWECKPDTDTRICDSCGGEYEYTRNIEVTYSTSPLTPPVIEDIES